MSTYHPSIQEPKYSSVSWEYFGETIAPGWTKSEPIGRPYYKDSDAYEKKENPVGHIKGWILMGPYETKEECIRAGVNDGC